MTIYTHSQQPKVWYSPGKASGSRPRKIQIVPSGKNTNLDSQKKESAKKVKKNLTQIGPSGATHPVGSKVRKLPNSALVKINKAKKRNATIERYKDLQLMKLDTEQDQTDYQVYENVLWQDDPETMLEIKINEINEKIKQTSDTELKSKYMKQLDKLKEKQVAQRKGFSSDDDDALSDTGSISTVTDGSDTDGVDSHK